MDYAALLEQARLLREADQTSLKTRRIDMALTKSKSETQVRELLESVIHGKIQRQSRGSITAFGVNPGIEVKVDAQGVHGFINGQPVVVEVETKFGVNGVYARVFSHADNRASQENIQSTGFGLAFSAIPAMAGNVLGHIIHSPINSNDEIAQKANKGLSARLKREQAIRERDERHEEILQRIAPALNRAILETVKALGEPEALADIVGEVSRQSVSDSSNLALTSFINLGMVADEPDDYYSNGLGFSILVSLEGWNGEGWDKEGRVVIRTRSVITEDGPTLGALACPTHGEIKEVCSLQNGQEVHLTMALVVARMIEASRVMVQDWHDTPSMPAP